MYDQNPLAAVHKTCSWAQPDVTTTKPRPVGTFPVPVAVQTVPTAIFSRPSGSLTPPSGYLAMWDLNQWGSQDRSYVQLQFTKLPMTSALLPANEPQPGPSAGSFNLSSTPLIRLLRVMMSHTCPRHRQTPVLPVESPSGRMNVKTDCLQKQRTRYGLENGRLGFIETLHKQQWSLQHCLRPPPTPHPPPPPSSYMSRTPFSNIPQWTQWFQRKWNIYTVEPQWLEHLWDHGNSFETWVVRATESHGTSSGSKQR